MSSQDERERALVRAAMRRGFMFGHVSESDYAERAREVIAAVDAIHPRTTSDAAAAVAAIVADMRDAARGYAASDFVQATVALRGEADRIEAAHPRPAEPAADLLRAVAEAVRDAFVEAAEARALAAEARKAKAGNALFLERLDGESWGRSQEAAYMKIADLNEIIATVRAR